MELVLNPCQVIASSMQVFRDEAEHTTLQGFALKHQCRRDRLDGLPAPLLRRPPTRRAPPPVELTFSCSDRRRRRKPP